MPCDVLDCIRSPISVGYLELESEPSGFWMDENSMGKVRNMGFESPARRVYELKEIDQRASACEVLKQIEEPLFVFYRSHSAQHHACSVYGNPRPRAAG